MAEFEIVPIAPERLAAMRRAGVDEHGNPWTARPAGGWEPLRCCLQLAEPGARVALICYSPWTDPSPWAEAGPVFVHADECAGYPTPDEYPAALRAQRQVLRPYGPDGSLNYRAITFVEPADDPGATVAAVLARPDVASVHVRSAVAGCFTFEARRTGAVPRS